MEVCYEDEGLSLILLCCLSSPFTNFRDKLLYGHDTPMLGEVFEALHTKKKIKHMVSFNDSTSNRKVLSDHGMTLNISKKRR